MGRSQSAQISDTAKANSAADQANAGAALSKTNKALADYSTNLKNYGAWGEKEFNPEGEFMRTANTLGTTVAAGGAAGTTGDLALNAMRTGENTASYAPTLAESRRANSRDLTSFLADENQKRIAALGAVKQFGVTASALPAEVQSSIYGTSLGAANAALGTAASASAASPGFWDVFGQDLAQGAGSAIGAYTGAKAACVIAMVLYGDQDLRTHLIRTWLNIEFSKSFIGKILVKLYSIFGDAIAARVRTSDFLRTIFKPIFDRALVKSMAWYGVTHV